jgi:hypothetical protein
VALVVAETVVSLQALMPLLALPTLAAAVVVVVTVRLAHF